MCFGSLGIVESLLSVLFRFLTEADERPGGEGERVKQAEGEIRQPSGQQPSCL